MNVPARTLVTGGTGFIGARLVAELLRRGIPLRVATRDPARARARWTRAAVEVAAVDLVSGAGAREACADVDTIYHLAGYAHADDAGAGAEALHRQTTVDGTRALLEAAAAQGVRRIVFLSSVKAMGEGTEGCVDESEPADPVTPYGKSKRQAEIMVLESGIAHACVLRLPLVYGPDWKGNLPKMAAAIARGRFPPPPRRQNRRSMIHVDDVVRALILVANCPAARGQIYLVADAAPYSTREIYEWMCESLGRRVPTWSVPMWLLRVGAAFGDALERVTGKDLPLDSRRLTKLFGSACYRTDKIQRELGFTARHNLRDSMVELLGGHQASGQ
jgi:nucleoside-diphosphate-sugar epimerase